LLRGWSGLQQVRWEVLDVCPTVTGLLELLARETSGTPEVGSTKICTGQVELGKLCPLLVESANLAKVWWLWHTLRDVLMAQARRGRGRHGGQMRMPSRKPDVCCTARPYCSHQASVPMTAGDR